jgi:archaellin
MTSRRRVVRGLALLGAAGVAGCLDTSGGTEGGNATPTTLGPDAGQTSAGGPDESGEGESLPSALQVVSAVGENAEQRRIGTVAVTVAKADWVDEVDLTGVTATWRTPGESYELVAQSSERSADGYFGIEPGRGTAADATLTTSTERHRLVFDLGDDDVEVDDRHPRLSADTTHFGSVLRRDDVVSLRLTTADESTTTVRLLAPSDVMKIEGTVALTVE